MKYRNICKDRERRMLFHRLVYAIPALSCLFPLSPNDCVQDAEHSDLRKQRVSYLLMLILLLFPNYIYYNTHILPNT